MFKSTYEQADQLTESQTVNPMDLCLYPPAHYQKVIDKLQKEREQSKLAEKEKKKDERNGLSALWADLYSADQFTAADVEETPLPSPRLRQVSNDLFTLKVVHQKGESHRPFECPYFLEEFPENCAWCDPAKQCIYCVNAWNKLRKLPRVPIDINRILYTLSFARAFRQQTQRNRRKSEMTDVEDEAGSRDGAGEAANHPIGNGEHSPPPQHQEGASDAVKAETLHSPTDIFSREIPVLPSQDISTMDPDTIDPDEHQDDDHADGQAVLRCELGHQLPSLNGLDAQEKKYDAETPHHNGDVSSRIPAFAKLQFEDGAYYMNTISVIIGRDLEIGREARRQENRRKRPVSAGEPQTPARVRGEDSRSVVSASGGFVGRNPRPRKSSNKSKSISSESDPIRTVLPLPATTFLNEPDMGSPEEIDVASLLPDPYQEPLVAIHQPAADDGIIPLSKGISRKHIKISYNYIHDGFEMTVLGRNGAFVDDHHHEKGEVVPLQHGSVIMIGGVTINFNLPIEALPEGDHQSSSGRMSLAFEDEEGADIDVDDEVDDFDDLGVPRRLEHYPDEDDSQGIEGDSSDSGNDEEEEDTARPRPVRLKVTTKRKMPTAKTSKLAVKNATKTQQKSQKAQGLLQRKQLLAKEKAKYVKPTTLKTAKKPQRPKDEDDVATSIEGADENAMNRPNGIIPAAEGKKPAKVSGDASKSLKSPTEDSAKVNQVSRDAPLINGEGVVIEGLAAGTVIPPRKKGPGRPPKDGIMSKRERGVLVKHQKEVEKMRRLGQDPSDLPPVDLSAPKPRPRTGSRDATAMDTVNAPSITPNVEVSEETSADKKPAKALKPAREPSPEMKESDYTPDQLERPLGNYVSLIHEILTEHVRLNLQGIYTAMEKKWPYFRFKAGSMGWQSSVRHNLGQNEAFRKAEKDGKGFLWELNPDVSIEPARKPKKQPSPPPAAQAYNHGYHGPRFPQQPQGFHPPLPQNGAYQNQPPSNPYQQARTPSSLPGVPHGSTAGQQPSNYSSPYANLPATAPSRPSSAQYPNGTTQPSQHARPQHQTNSSQPQNGSDPRKHSSMTPLQDSLDSQKQPFSRPAPEDQIGTPWAPDTLIATVKRIYVDKIPKSHNLHDVCSRAVSVFLRPDLFSPDPPLLEVEHYIVLALGAAHHSQMTGKPVQAPPEGVRASSGPSQSQSPAPVPQQQQHAPVPGKVDPLHARAQAQTEAQFPSQAQVQMPVPRVQTPQAPQPEPLTRPNSSQGERAGGSNTPPYEPAQRMPNGSSMPSNLAAHGPVTGMKRSADEMASLGNDDETKRARLE